MSTNSYLYQNITISGLPGNGSTTLLNTLREALKEEGWKGFSGGEFMRNYALEKGLFDGAQTVHHDATVYGDDFDRQVDLGIREKVQTEKMWIIESWLAGFMAQGVVGTLKVLMTCSNDALRIDRLVNRDHISIDAAKHHIHERKQKNESKWQRMYAPEWQQFVVAAGRAKPDDPIDFWRPDLYDKVIDTYSVNQEDALKLVLDAITKK